MSMPRGWTRIAVDQIVHRSKRVRILKVTFRASGGGHMYVVSFKEKDKGGIGKDVWCRPPGSPQDLAEAIELAESLL